MHTNIQSHTYKHAHARSYTHTHTHTHTYIRIRMHTYIHTYIHSHTHEHAQAWSLTHTHARARKRTNALKQRNTFAKIGVKKTEKKADQETDSKTLVSKPASALSLQLAFLEKIPEIPS